MDPFPSAFQGKFDLVHVRYATSFIRPDQVATALKNISQLVKPGGYLVWTETHVSKFTLTNPENERHREIWQIAVDFVAKTGSADLPDQLLQAAREQQGLEVCEEHVGVMGMYLYQKKIRYVCWSFELFILFRVCLVSLGIVNS